MEIPAGDLHQPTLLLPPHYATHDSNKELVMIDKRALRMLETRLGRIQTAVEEAEQILGDLVADAENETGPENERGPDWFANDGIDYQW